MNIGSQLRNFWRSLRSKEPVVTHRHVGHSLAKALGDASHVAGGKVPQQGTTDKQSEIIADAHERYSASFDDKG